MSTVDASYARLGEALLQRERKIKQEMAAVALLWLVGCPVLCCLSDDSDTLYGAPEEGLCGLVTYSISASMTGHYPKVLGSVMAPLLAVLVVQRTSTGLCSILKLGWLVRFSPLVKSENKHLDDENTRSRASKLWHHIAKIEFLGYFAGACLIVLVAFDAQNFLPAHMFFSQLAFFSLFRQNQLVERLGTDFKDLFPNWPSQHANRVFRWGMLHFCFMWFGFVFLATMSGLGRCNDILHHVDLLSEKTFGNTTTMRWLVAVAYWFNEYAFVFLFIYVQLLQHFELRLWEFVGATSMPYIGIVSRFSMWGAIEQFMFGASDANVLLGTRKKTKAS